MAKGIILDNAATTGALVISGPVSGVSTMSFPDTSNEVGVKDLAFDGATGKVILKSVPSVPTVVSAFTNDAGYQTDVQVTASVNTAVQNLLNGAPAAYDTLKEIADKLADGDTVSTALTAQVANKANTADLSAVAFSGAYADLTGAPTVPTLPTVVSAFTNDAGYQSASQVTATVNTAIAGVIDGAPEALNTLKEISDKLAADDTVVGALTTQIAGKANTADLAVVATSGSYADLTNKPTIPTVPTIVSAFTNDAGYITAASVPVATTSVAGVVKAGAGLTVAPDGTLSTTGSATLPNGDGTTTVVASVTTTNASVISAMSSAVSLGKVVMFTANVVGKTSGGANVAGYTLEGVVRNVGGTVSFSGSAMKYIVAEDNAGWDADAVTTETGFNIVVQGSAATTVTWVISTKITSIA